jgi:hypothetical protein
MRRLLLTLSVAAALVAVAQPAEAQLKYGLQGALMTALEEASSLNGTIGIGPRVALQPPLLPIGVVGQGVYYFPEGDGSYMTYSLAAQLRLPLPMVNPYAIGGWQWRRSSANDVSETVNGAMIGVGVQLNLAVSVFLEGSFEFNDEVTGFPDLDNNPIVIKGGVLLGS